MDENLPFLSTWPSTTKQFEMSSTCIRKRVFGLNDTVLKRNSKNSHPWANWQKWHCIVLKSHGRGPTVRWHGSLSHSVGAGLPHAHRAAGDVGKASAARWACGRPAPTEWEHATWPIAWYAPSWLLSAVHVLFLPIHSHRDYFLFLLFHRSTVLF